MWHKHKFRNILPAAYLEFEFKKLISIIDWNQIIYN